MLFRGKFQKAGHTFHEGLVRTWNTVRAAFHRRSPEAPAPAVQPVASPAPLLSAATTCRSREPAPAAVSNVYQTEFSLSTPLAGKALEKEVKKISAFFERTSYPEMQPLLQLITEERVAQLAINNLLKITESLLTENALLGFKEESVNVVNRFINAVYAGLLNPIFSYEAYQYTIDTIKQRLEMLINEGIASERPGSSLLGVCPSLYSTKELTDSIRRNTQDYNEGNPDEFPWPAVLINFLYNLGLQKSSMDPTLINDFKRAFTKNFSAIESRLRFNLYQEEIDAIKQTVDNL